MSGMSSDDVRYRRGAARAPGDLGHCAGGSIRRPSATSLLTSLYLVTDVSARVRWLGQASRDDDLVGRAAHARDPERRPVFTTLRVLHLEDRTPGPVLDVSEGRCADLLGLRGRMGGRRWPSSANWARRVAPASMAVWP